MLYDFEKEQSKNILKGFSDIDDIIKGRKAYPIGTIHNGYKKIAANKWRKTTDLYGADYTDSHVDKTTLKELIHGKKNKWVVLSAKQKEKIATNLVSLINTAYESIGGNFEIKTAKDVIDSGLFFKVIDMDDDPFADALMVYKKTDAGKKHVIVGQDGTKEAKSIILQKYGDDYHKSGYYGEVSGKLSEILLNKFHAPFVNDKDLVERAIGKKIDWIGDGWYKREITGGGVHEKILLGIPKFKDDGK